MLCNPWPTLPIPSNPLPPPPQHLRKLPRLGAGTVGPRQAGSSLLTIEMLTNQLWSQSKGCGPHARLAFKMSISITADASKGAWLIHAAPAWAGQDPHGTRCSKTSDLLGPWNQPQIAFHAYCTCPCSGTKNIKQRKHSPHIMSDRRLAITKGKQKKLKHVDV